MLEWLNYSWIINTLIIASIIVGFVIFVLSITILIKPKLKKESFKYFYAFSAGFMLIVSILGLYKEGGDKAKSVFGGSLDGIEILWVILILISGITLASLAIYGTKRFVNPKKCKKTSIEKHKWVGLIMIFIHRVPASIVIGLLSITPQGHGALLLGIMLHLIPEVLILYYRQTEMGYSTRKAVRNSIGIKLIFFLMIVIGSGISKLIESVAWIQSLLLIIAGTTMFYAVISELIPEFIGFLNPHHHSPHCKDETPGEEVDSIEHLHEVVAISCSLRRVMTKLSFWLIMGLMLATLILTVT